MSDKGERKNWSAWRRLNTKLQDENRTLTEQVAELREGLDLAIKHTGWDASKVRYYLAHLYRETDPEATR